MSDKSSFPTRDGIATGKANERQMLERGGMSNEGFRTDLRDNPDGSTTMLRTRGGSPEFSTVAAQRPLDGQPVARGFVAHAFGKSYGALFDPYTLAIEDKRFSIRFATYHVSSVAASAYAPRNWLDVWSWDGATMRINGQLAKTFFPFRFPAAVRQAIPYLRTWPSAPIYGDKWQNSDFPKRIYAVGPESVGIATDPRWASVIAPLKLTPETPRSDHKALVCGPAINRSLHEATMAQLYFTGDSWDALVGGWAYSSTKVAMLLTQPYLQATNSSAAVEMARPGLASAGTSSGTMNTDTTLPATGVGLQGSPVLNLRVPYDGHALPITSIVWPWSSAVQKPLAGSVDASYSRDAYGSTSPTTDTVSAAGQTLTYSGVNFKNYDTRNESTRVKVQTVALSDGPTLVSAQTSISTSGDSLIWGNTDTGYGPGDVEGHIKTGSKYYTPQDGTLSGSSVTGRAYKTQTGDFSVTMGGMTLVDLHFWREQSSGNKAVLTGRTDYYAPYLASPSGLIGVGSGMGIGNTLSLVARTYPGNDDATPILWYKASGDVSTRYQPPEAIAEVNAFVDALAAAYLGIPYFDSENNSGYAHPNLYYVSVSPSVTLDDLTLTWSTRDFLLHDETNGVFITVDGNFSATKSYGASASATLTVVLNIETPWGSGSKVLYDLDYTYSDMLPEEDIGSGGKTAIPSPKIMAVFAPKHREQGTFPGAAYVTQDEVGNGAMPAILVNFVLVLEPYSFIGSAETDGLTHLVPVNLLEMLYAYVFSRKYGIDPYQRYPVSDTAAFNTIMAGLFNVQHHIQFRDGAMDEWLIGLGLPYFTEHKTELSRV